MWNVAWYLIINFLRRETSKLLGSSFFFPEIANHQDPRFLQKCWYCSIKPNCNHHDHINAGGNDGRVIWLPSSARRLTIFIVTKLLSQLNTNWHKSPVNTYFGRTPVRFGVGVTLLAPLYMMRWYHWRLALSCWNWVPRAFPPGSNNRPEFNKFPCYPTNGVKRVILASVTHKPIVSRWDHDLITHCPPKAWEDHIQLVLNWALWTSTASKRNSISTLYMMSVSNTY